MIGVTFGEKHSYNDFGLILSSKEISYPKVKENKIEVLGANGYIDLTEISGNGVKYENRTLSFTFTLLDPNEWERKKGDIANYLHGIKMKVTLDSDPPHYYYGRGSINSFKSDKAIGTMVVDFDVEPFKYIIETRGENWLWDTIDFEEGGIIDDDIVINDFKSVTMPSNPQQYVPVFNVASASNLKISYSGVSYDLKIGRNRFPKIICTGGEVLQFSGSGRLIIDYQRGIL